jgi:hypothetical protein
MVEIVNAGSFSLKGTKRIEKAQAELSNPTTSETV